MTIEEAISELKKMYPCLCLDSMDDTMRVIRANAAIDMAIAALEARVPHVLTLDDVKQLQKKSSVWVENNGKTFGRKGTDEKWKTLQMVFYDSYVAYLEQYPTMQFLVYDDMLECANKQVFRFDEIDYGVTWRCWNDEPSDEQAEAVAWESGERSETETETETEKSKP